MNFIGVIGKNKILKNIIDEHVNIIKINNQNVDSVKNVKFEIIVINDNLNKFYDKLESLKNIINNTEYIIVNADLEMKIDIFNDINKKIITCGLNQKSTITISSRTQDDVLIDLQRDIETLDGKTVEAGEHLITLRNRYDFKVHDILINYAISIIFNKKIMNVI